MLKVKDLKDRSTEELEDSLKTQMKEIFELRGQQLDGKTQKIHLIGHKKKEIARIKTIIRERELAR